MSDEKRSVGSVADASNPRILRPFERFVAGSIDMAQMEREIKQVERELEAESTEK